MEDVLLNGINGSYKVKLGLRMEKNEFMNTGSKKYLRGSSYCFDNSTSTF